MTINRDYSVGILSNHTSVRIHTEGSDAVLELLCAVHNLALIQLVSQMREQLRRKFHPDSDIHSVGIGRDLKFLTDLLHPLTSASTYRSHTLISLIYAAIRRHPEATVNHLHLLNRRHKVEVNLILQVVIEILKHHIINIRAQMSHRSIQKLKLILHADCLNPRVGRRIQLRALSAVLKVNPVHILHQLRGLLTTDIFI